MHPEPVQSPDTTPAAKLLAASAAAPKSWGEKYSGTTLHIIRNWVVNYFINFMGSAALTYAFDVSPVGRAMTRWTQRVAERHADLISPNITTYTVNYLTRSQLMLMGGHSLQPLMKLMHDHKNRIEYRIGHWLDALQETLGRGDAASRRALAEYDRMEAIRGGERVVVPADAALLARHHMDQNGEFIEERQPWMMLVKARLYGMAASGATNVLFALSSAKAPKGFRFEQDYERPFAEWTAKHVITKTPGLRTAFGAQPDLMGRYFFNDMFLTYIAKEAYDFSERQQMRELHKAQAPTHEIAKTSYQDRVVADAVAPEMKQR